MSACLDPAVIARIAESDPSVDPQHLRHAADCPKCSERVALTRAIIAAGVTEIAEEAAVVESLLDELRAERQSRWARIVQADLRFHRVALARRMLVLALVARESDTRLALAFSESATKIVEALAPRETSAGNLRFDAWRYHSMLLREIGHYHVCADALAKAEEVAPATADPELSAAVVALGRALFAIEPDVWQPEEAERYLDRAEAVFARKDAARLLQTKSTRGIAAFRSGEFERAASIFADVLETSASTHNAAHADALGNYLFNAVQAGRCDSDLFSAVETLERSDESARRDLAVLRDRWIRGLLFFNRDELPEAIVLLRDTMRGFDAKGDADTAIRAGLDALRALLAAERYDEAIELARDLASRAIGLDKRQPTRRRTLTAEALSYLREAAQRQLLTADIAALVRTYVDRITYQRPVSFVPPMPLHPM